MALPLALVFVLLLSSGCRAMCPEDWVAFGQSCYAFVDELVTWSTASQMCQALQSRLVEVDTVEENSFLTSQLKSRQLPSAWTGLQDFVHEGRWVLTSTLLQATFFNWDNGQPDNASGRERGEDCVIISGRDGSWDDYWCDNTHNSAVVCESPAVEEEIVVG